MLTQYDYYKQAQERYPDAVILMLDFDSYYILGPTAQEVLPIIKMLLTHPHAGKCYSWSPSDGGYPSLSFGKHNLDRVLREIIRSGKRAIIDNYNTYRQTPEYKKHEEETFAHFRKMKQEQERKEKAKNPVQTSLFDEWFS